MSARLSLAKGWPFAATLLVSLVLYRFGIELLVALAAGLVLSWVAYQFRVATLAALSLVVLVPQLFLMIDLLPADWDVIAAGIRISDALLVGMLGASVANVLVIKGRPSVDRVLMGTSAVLGVLLLYAIVRNLGAFGLSAPGEFRFRYLILSLPLYLALAIRDEHELASVQRVIAVLPVLGVITALPVVVAAKGWDVGADSRFYPSAISLALLYSAIWFGISATRDRLRSGRVVSTAVLLLAGVFIVADSHRSVWLVAALSSLVLIRYGFIRLSRIWAWGLGAALGIGVVGVIVGLSGVNVLEYVSTRASAFLNPTADATSYWRLVVWKAYLGPWLANPVLGQGFGAYWDIYVPEFGGRTTVFPHSLYVVTLVKLGASGLAALLGWFYAAWRALAFRVRQQQGVMSISVPLVMGVLGVVGSLAYGTVYHLEFWSLAWLGVGLAEVSAFESSRPDWPRTERSLRHSRSFLACNSGRPSGERGWAQGFGASERIPLISPADR